MDQLHLFESNTSTSLKLFRRFPGGKSHAAPFLSKLIPSQTKQIVSPFVGGGSFELFLTHRDIKVHAYDKFEPLVNCWQYALKDSEKLATWISEILLDNTREQLRELQKGKFFEIKDPFERAGYYWLLSSLGWNGCAFNGMYKYTIIDGQAWIILKDGSLNNLATDFKKLRQFHNSNLTVSLADFKESLNRHNDLFAYCDPPYPDVGGSMYGIGHEYHEEFNHEELADCLLSRTTPWMLSYNNKPLIRELYPEDKCIWHYQWWKQPTNLTNRTTDQKEVVILSKNFYDQ